MNRLSLSLFFILIGVIVHGCGDKETKEKSQPNNRSLLENQKILNKKSTSAHKPIIEGKKRDTFLFSDGNRSYHLKITSKALVVNENKKPIFIISLLDKNTIPSQAQAHITAQLEKHYPSFVNAMVMILDNNNTQNNIQLWKKKIHTPTLFVASGDKVVEATKTLLQTIKHDTTLHLPFTLLIHRGHIYHIYEGVIPMEMLEHDIQTLLRKKEQH